jgi:hypothetical protein
MSYTNYNMDTATYGGIRNDIFMGPGVRMDSLFTPTAAQNHAMGRILHSNDGTGRMWRYCKNGAVALVQAFTVSSEAPSGNGLAVLQTGYTTSVGDIRFDMLLTTGHAYADHELADGWLYLNKTISPLADQYLIKDNWIKTSDTVMTIEIADENGIRVATTASHEMTVIKHFCRDVVVTPTTQAAMIVGVPNVAVTANYYFWAQYRGPCAVIGEDTTVIGNPIGYPATPNTAGTIGPIGADTDPTLGVCMQAGANDEPSLVMLNIP